jgi:hypothetical protein
MRNEVLQFVPRARHCSPTAKSFNEKWQEDCMQDIWVCTEPSGPLKPISWCGLSWVSATEAVSSLLPPYQVFSGTTFSAKEWRPLCDPLSLHQGSKCYLLTVSASQRSSELLCCKQNCQRLWNTLSMFDTFVLIQKIFLSFHTLITVLSYISRRLRRGAERAEQNDV